MCQCRFITYNKCTTLVKEVNGEEGYMGQKLYGNSVISPQFFIHINIL